MDELENLEFKKLRSTLFILLPYRKDKETGRGEDDGGKG